jgi:hypothetical protein
MSTPQDQLIQGVECLRPLMEENGFQFSLGEAGKGSGGGFATGQFTSGDRALSFSVRYGLGLVEYRVGRSCISHEEYLRYSGVWGRHAYPNFGGSVQDGFAALQRDLVNHFHAFLSGADTEFLGVVQARDAEPNKFKGLAGLGGKR